MILGRVIVDLEKTMSEQGMNWADMEIAVEGKKTRALKRKISFNVNKLNEMLKEVGLRLSLEKVKD